MIKNGDVPWHEHFDAPSYHQDLGYADGVIAADKAVTRIVIGTLSQRDVRSRLGSGKTAIDICNGGVPRLIGLIQPTLDLDARIIQADVSGSAVDSSLRTITDVTKNDKLGMWKEHEKDMRRYNPAWKRAIGNACLKSEVRELSIFDLPEEEADVVTIGHGPESFTEDPEECKLGFQAGVRAGKHGALIVVTYSADSTGYRVGERHWPATAVDPPTLSTILEDTVEIVKSVVVPAPDMRKETETSHTGIGVMVGFKR